MKIKNRLFFAFSGVILASATLALQGCSASTSAVHNAGTGGSGQRQSGPQLLGHPHSGGLASSAPNGMSGSPGGDSGSVNPSCGTELSPPSVNGNSIYVPAGGNLQAAVNNASAGDEIVLEAGAAFSGPIVLGNKPGDSYITIRSSAVSNLPGAGTRVSPGDAWAMPKIVAPPTGEGALLALNGAHNYYITGIEFLPASGVYSYGLVAIGAGTETSYDALPHDIVLDRVYIHGDRNTGSKRGLSLNGRSVSVANSWISDIKGTSQDTQAICGWNGPGPFQILNNHLEGSGENVLFGGIDPSLDGVVPSDILIQYNHFYKPLSWKVGSPNYEGTHWLVKNLFELKNSRRVIVDSNLFENSWRDAQSGFAVLFTVRNQDGRAPWSVVENVQFSNNVVRHAGSGMMISGHDDNYPSQLANTFLIQNNLFYDIGDPFYGGAGQLFMTESGTGVPGPANLTIDHNTGFVTSYYLVAGNQGGSDSYFVPRPGFVFTNNIVPHNSDGIFGPSAGAAGAALSAYFPGALFASNVLIGASSGSYSAYPGNFFPGSVADVGFVDYYGGDFRLADASGYRGAAGNGADIGVQMDLLQARSACTR